MRIGPVSHIPALLSSHGVKLAPILRAVGLPRDALANPDNAITILQMARLVSVCAKRTGRPHFGLLAGQSASLTQLGLVGLQMLNAETVGAAWRGLILNLHLNGRAMVPALTVSDGMVGLSFSFYASEAGEESQFVDYSLAIACNAMRTLGDRRWAPAEVHISRRAPPDVGPYRRFFMAPVHFNSDRSALLFPAAWLARRVLGANARTRRALEETIRQALGLRKLELDAQVRRALFVQIGRGDVSIDGVARTLGMHKRTLNRRLAEAGTSFVKLLAEVRQQTARQLLSESDLPLVDIAAALCYADSSTFSRAFHGWFGTAPSAWRRTRRQARASRAI